MADSPFTGESIPDLLRARVDASPDVEAYWHEADGTWHPTTWRQFSEKVDRLAAGLVSKGLTPGTHVGLLFPTSLEWEVAHHAVLRAGGVVVGLEPHDTAERLHWIIGHADVKILIVQDRAMFEKIASHGDLDLQMVVFVANEPIAKATREESLSVLHGHGADKSMLPSVRPEAAATIIYTSGTTGQPKGILYRHEQVVLAIKAITAAYPTIAVGSRFVCWLPLSNLFQRIMNLAAMQVGGTVYLVKNPLDVMKALPVAKPNIFIGVPRFYEKLYGGIQKEVDRRPAPLRWLLRKSIELALAVWRAGSAGEQISATHKRLLSIIDRAVLSRLRRVMGGRIQFMITGSAPTPMRLLEFFHAIGLPLYEAYGMSENVVPMAMNCPNAFKLGSVGRPLPVNEFRLADDGELLVRGPGVFAGYEKTTRSDALSLDKYYATGDFAAFDSEGFLSLAGRKSELIKTSTGRRIAPTKIEEALNLPPGVDRIVVMGSGRKCLIALVALKSEPAALDSSDMNWDVKSTLDKLEKSALDLVDHERPAGYLILQRPLSLALGEVTPNLKVRRSFIETKWRSELEAIYRKIEREPNFTPYVIIRETSPAPLTI